MRLIWTYLGLTLALGMVASGAQATIRYVEISGSTAIAENGCPAWVLETNDDDCSYDAGKPLDLGNSQWIGPVFSAGYYAPGTAPLTFSNTDLGPGPVSAPAPELPLGGKIGIPIARGFISIDDAETQAGIDDIIGGTLEFGAFQRNVAVSASARVIESIDRVIHRISRVRVNDATQNASGGYDYVVAEADNAPAFPVALSGNPAFGGGFFPSEIGSQSTADPLDTPFWTAPGSHGLAILDGTSAIQGTRSTASVWGYTCDNGGPGPAACLTNGANWDGDSRVAYSNILLQISTDSSGNVIAANAFLVQESDLSLTAKGNDSWTATRLSFAGIATTVPAAFDDRRVLEVEPVAPPPPFPDTLPSTNFDVLANDQLGVAPVTLSIVTPPASGTATVTVAPETPNLIKYTAGSRAESEQTIVYQFTDVDGATATAALHVVVSHPVTCKDDTAATQRDTAATVNVTANDSGFDNPPPTTVIVTTAPETGTTVVNPDRTITYTPPANTGGVFNIIYALQDGANNPVSCNVRIQIPAQPQAVDDTVGISVDTATTKIDVLANDLEVTDVPITDTDPPVQLAIVTGPTHGTATIDASSRTAPKIDYAQNPAYLGPDQFTYTVTDADGDVSNVANVNITVFGPPQNDVPACTDDTVDGDRDVPTTIDVLANDTGLNALPIAVEVVATSVDDDNSSTVVNPDNTITFTPPTGTGGPVFIRYRAHEALNSPVQCDVTVKVDDLPVANDDELFGVNFGEVFSVGILSNDTGLSDEPIELAITQQPVHGTVNVCDAPSAECGAFTAGSQPYITYIYDDAVGYPASDSFKYHLRDKDGDTSADATAIVTAKNVLTAEDDPQQRCNNAPRSVWATSGFSKTLNVLTNDGGLLRTPIRMSIDSTQAGGTAVVNANNTITFTPAEDFTGCTGVTYRLTDADGKTDTAVATVVVFPAPVTDTGGSSFDWSLAAILGAGLALRRRPLRRSRRSPTGR